MAFRIPTFSGIPQNSFLMKKILSIIVLAQFFCTSLWFATNAVILGLSQDFEIKAENMSDLTSAVQFGFITGTLLFALTNIADRFPPSKVFFWCALFGALANLGLILDFNVLSSLLLIRFLVGLLLAGIYPVGMKIAADYFNKELGTALGYLVGALVLGTALPHFIKVVTIGFEWKLVIYATSGLAFLGGLSILLFVPDGPNRAARTKLNLSAIVDVFKAKPFRAAAFGYFGHMWELYTFWAFVPVILTFHNNTNSISLNVSLWSFIIIAIGGLGCVLGGYLSINKGIKTIAAIALSISGLCCLISPLMIGYASTPLLLLFLLIWGITVITDSPLFSTLVATNAASESKGTALTIVNCIGFSLTIVSIQLLQSLSTVLPFYLVFLLLLPGPIFGLVSLYRK